MSIGAFFWALSAILFGLLALDIISKYEQEIAYVGWGLIPLGLLFAGVPVPVPVFVRREG